MYSRASFLDTASASLLGGTIRVTATDSAGLKKIVSDSNREARAALGGLSARFQEFRSARERYGPLWSMMPLLLTLISKENGCVLVDSMRHE